MVYQRLPRNPLLHRGLHIFLGSVQQSIRLIKGDSRKDAIRKWNLKADTPKMPKPPGGAFGPQNSFSPRNLCAEPTTSLTSFPLSGGGSTSGFCRESHNDPSRHPQVILNPRLPKPWRWVEIRLPEVNAMWKRYFLKWIKTDGSKMTPNVSCTPSSDSSSCCYCART